jgi:hypothetical protein
MVRILLFSLALLLPGEAYAQTSSTATDLELSAAYCLGYASSARASLAQSAAASGVGEEAPEWFEKELRREFAPLDQSIGRFEEFLKSKGYGPGQRASAPILLAKKRGAEDFAACSRAVEACVGNCSKQCDGRTDAQCMTCSKSCMPADSPACGGEKRCEQVEKSLAF